MKKLILFITVIFLTSISCQKETIDDICSCTETVSTYDGAIESVNVLYDTTNSLASFNGSAWYSTTQGQFLITHDVAAGMITMNSNTYLYTGIVVDELYTGFNLSLNELEICMPTMEQYLENTDLLEFNIEIVFRQ